MSIHLSIIQHTSLELGSALARPDDDGDDEDDDGDGDDDDNDDDGV